jgi:hypothetical protein
MVTQNGKQNNTEIIHFFFVDGVIIYKLLPLPMLKLLALGLINVFAMSAI